MKQLAEWTFEGVPDTDIRRQGATETASVIFAAYMLVYERVDFTSMMGGTADLLIRPRYRKLCLGFFILSKKSDRCASQLSLLPSTA